MGGRMRVGVIGAILLAQLSIFGFAAPTVSAADGSMTGVVTSGVTPIKGATVFVFSQAPGSSPVSMITGDDGSYSIAAPEGPAFVQVNAPGYSSQSGTETLSAATVTVRNFDLVPLPPIVMSGRLVDGSGTALVGTVVATAFAFGGVPPQVITNPTNGDGTLSIALPPNTWLLSFTSPGFLPATRSSVFTTTDFGDIVLSPGASLAGTVRDSSGNGIAGATVSAFGFSGFPVPVTTDVNGRYSLPLGQPGTYSVQVALPGYATVRNATMGGVNYPVGSTTFDAVLRRVGSLSGVVRSPSGAPIANLSVRAQEAGGSMFFPAITDANGLYSIANLSPGSYRILTSTVTPLWRPIDQIVEVLEGPAPTTLALVFKLGSTVTLFNSSGPIMQAGNLVAACLDPGVPSVSVFFQCDGTAGVQWAGFSNTDANGVAPLPPLAPGTYNLRAGNGPTVPAATLQVVVTTDNPEACNFYLDGSSPSVCVPIGTLDPDPDDDGIDDVVEAGAPNGGDGNNDGFQDSAQRHVASLPDPTGVGAYLTLAAPSDQYPLSNVTATDPSGLPSPPIGVDGESAIVGFSVGVPTPGGTVSVEVYLNDPTSTINSYWKYSPSGGWVDASALASFTPASGGRTKVTLTLTDGGAGDQDGVADGTIIDPGLFAASDRTPPTITCPAVPNLGFRSVGASLTATVTDTGAGVSSPTVTVPINTTLAGPRTVNVTATDNLGNRATVPCGYRVTYTVKQLTPSASTALRSVRNNTTVPFTFQLRDAVGAPVLGNVVTAPTSATVSCPGGTAIPLLSSTGLPATTFTVGDGIWYAGWSPTKMLRGTCQRVTIALADGSRLTYVVKVT